MQKVLRISGISKTFLPLPEAYSKTSEGVVLIKAQHNMHPDLGQYCAKPLTIIGVDSMAEEINLETCVAFGLASNGNPVFATRIKSLRESVEIMESIRYSIIKEGRGAMLQVVNLLEMHPARLKIGVTKEELRSIASFAQVREMAERFMREIGKLYARIKVAKTDILDSIKEAVLRVAEVTGIPVADGLLVSAG